MARQRNQNRENMRTERVSLVLTPAAYDGLAALAQIRCASVNDILNNMVEKLIAKNSGVIERYNEALANARAETNIEVDDED